MAYTPSYDKCPSCRKTIAVNASVCPYCRSTIFKVTEKGIMQDDKVPVKIKKFLRYAPLGCSAITFLYFNQVTNKSFTDWLLIIFFTLGTYALVHFALRMNITHNETKD